MSANGNEEKMNKTPMTPDDYLEQFLGTDTKIFIDTCSMLEESFPLFVKHARPILEKTGNRIIVPLVVNKELVHHMDNPEKPYLREPAIRALSILEKNKNTLFRILGDEGDTFPDNLFQTLYIRFRVKYQMLFITQDRGLAADLLNANNSQSVWAKFANVKKLTPQGYLGNMQVVRENGRWVVPDKKSVGIGNVFTSQSKSTFRTCDKPTAMQDDILALTEVPGEYDTVFAMNPKTGQYAELALKGKLASGGEGAVYETDSKYVAKIYREDKVTSRRKEKILLMAKKDLECEGICLPVLPIYNSHSEFVGYLMEKASGKELGRSVFCPYIKNVHPDWKRADLVQLCITILKKIEYLHARNILMGDINPANILVTSPTEVFFVDTDSYQIEDLPCPVGQCNYTAPEIQGRNYNDFLRTMGNENFAIATLLFQILLPGKLPYAHTGGGKQNENILEMNFPYRLGENGNRKEPDGQWKFMWSHLPYAVKAAFYNTFQKAGTYSQEKNRLSAGQWLKLMNQYQGLLAKGLLAKNDPMSEAVFPTRFKAGSSAKWLTCKHCGEKFPYYENDNHKYSTPFEYCYKCKNEIADWLVCEDCGEEFPIYVPAFDFLKEKGYQMPKRCPDCKKAKKEKEEEKPEVVPEPVKKYSFVFQPYSGTRRAPSSFPAAPAPAPRPIATPRVPDPVPRTVAATPRIPDPAPRPEPVTRRVPDPAPRPVTRTPRVPDSAVKNVPPTRPRVSSPRASEPSTLDRVFTWLFRI